MNSRSDKTKCEGSVNASGTINKKWLELIWLLHIRCKTKDVICYQRYNDPFQGLLQSLTFTISIWATHKYNTGRARNTKEDTAEVSSVPPRYTTWSMLSNVVTAQLLKTLMPVISHPPSSRQINLLQGNQVSRFENSFDETLGNCRATIPQSNSACTRHGAQGVCDRGKKSVSDGSEDRLLRCPAPCLLNPTQQTSPHSSTWRRKKIQVPKRCVIFWIRKDGQSPDTWQA